MWAFVTLIALSVSAAESSQLRDTTQAASTDPFADLETSQPQATHEETARAWKQKFFGENFGFRKEIP